MNSMYGLLVVCVIFPVSVDVDGLASETCRVVKINQINRIICISLVFYKTSITKMHGTMNIKL